MIHPFDPEKKITTIETIFNKLRHTIMRINFYHSKERLVEVGDGDRYVSHKGGRIDVFEIADDEQLIGCELS